MLSRLGPVVGIGLLCVMIPMLQAACELPPVPEITSQPGNTQSPPVTSTPEPSQTPVSQPTPTPTAQPVPTPTPQPNPTLRPVPTPEQVPTPIFVPEPPPEPTPTPQPTPSAKGRCEQATPQPITPEQEAVIAEWHEATGARMREFAAYAPEAFKEYTQRFDYNSGALRPFIAWALCDEALALRLLEMPFLADDRGDGLDGDVLAALARLTDPDVGDVDELLLHPLLEDGITEVERVFVLVLALEYEDPDAAATIQSVPWVQELMREVALSANDFDASRSSLNIWILRRLVEMADLSPVSLRVFLELPWVREQGI